jgi:hypothetical protein
LPFLFASVLFASLAANTHTGRADSADSIRFSSGVTLFSPINKTYTSSFLTLNFSFACGWGIKYSLNYDIDGKYEGPMPYVIKNPGELHVVYYATGLVKLPELSEGSHSLTVYLEAPRITAHKSSYADTVNFAIDLTPPNILILSPANKTYTADNSTTASIPLNFTVNENVSQVAFNLDGQGDISIGGNTTLSGLSIGSHNVTVYARDLTGKTGTSETVNFTIVAEPQPQPEPEPFPTTFVATASGASTAIIGIALLLYFNKHKSKAENISKRAFFSVET